MSLKKILVRVIVGAALASGFGVAVIIGGSVFTLALMLFIIGAQWEFYGLGQSAGQRPYRFTGMAGALLFMIYVHYRGLDQGALLLLTGVVFAVLGVHPFLAGAESRDWKDAALSVVGFLYTALPGAMGIHIRQTMGMWITFFLFACIWSFDIFAFFTGKIFGKHRIFPRISPSKTWEGLIGGLVFAVIAGLVLNIFVGWSPVKAGVLAGVISLVGHLGDFFESAVKRDVGVKDSSALLPGHGGILDRIDALLFATPAFYMIMLLWK